MKRINNLYEQIIDIDNCRLAIIECSRHKRNRVKVCEILNNIDFYAKDLQQRLINKNFLTPYKQKIIRDNGSGKLRELLIPSFYPDQCSHYAIMNIIKPIVLKSSYYWSCANIKGRGIKRAAIGTTNATLRDIKHSKYCVKLDIKKFYPSVNHDILKEKLEHKIKDYKTLELINIIIDSVPNGLPLGNYTSPYLAELYLQSLDCYIKQELKIKHYIRYCDDMVLIGSNKRYLHKCMALVMEYVQNKLDLVIKSNYQLFKVKGTKTKGRAIDFVGYQFCKGYTKVRKSRCLRFIKTSKKLQKHITFKLAIRFITQANCLLYTNSFKLKQKYYSNINILKLKEKIKYENTWRS